MIRSCRVHWPRIAPFPLMEEGAQLIGNVEVGKNSSIWFSAVLQRDVNWIRTGEDSNVQYGSIIHRMNDVYKFLIGHRVATGYSSILNGYTVEDGCLIGMGAVVLNNGRIGQSSIVGAGTVVPEDTQIPSGSLVLGVPARHLRSVTAEDHQLIERHVKNYIQYKDTYLAETQHHFNRSIRE